MLRSVQQVGRLAAAQSAGAIAAVAAAPLVLQANAIVSIAQLAFIVSAAQACAVTTAALPLWKRWTGVGSRGISLGVIAGVAGYGAANVVMGLATTAVFLFIGRSYLAAGAVVPAAHIAALAWFGEPVASMLAAGIYASTFPAYCASTEAAASRVLANSLRALVLVSSAGLVATAVFAPVLIPMLFDSRFAGIVPLLPLQLLATYGRCLTIMLGVPLLARGRVAIVTGLHLAWAAAIAIGATAGLAGPRAYVLTVAAVTGAHALVLALVLARLKLAVSRSAYAWLVCGAIPLLLVMVL
jgi:hypothetical protein